MSTISLSSHLAVFAKYWEPGQVKTRLANAVGPLAASQLHRSFVLDILRRFSDISDRRSIAIWPAHRYQEFQLASPVEWGVCPQASGNLGNKLTEFFRAELNKSPQRLVVIGSDSPDLPREYLLQAFQALLSHQVVLGPASDGGYVLVGMNKFTPIFDAVEWSSPQVLSQTIRRLEQLNVGFAVLNSWHDVDFWDDLVQLKSRLDQPHGDPELAGLLSRINEILDSVPS